MSQQGQQVYEFGPYRLDPSEQVLTEGTRKIPLTPKAFQTLLVLVENHGRIVEKEELLAKVWSDAFVEEATLAQNIFTLRKQLGDDRSEPTYIETIPKRGYRFTAEVRILTGSPPPPLGVDQLNPARVPRSGSQASQFWPRKMAWVVVGLLIVAGTAFWRLRIWRPRPDSPQVVSFQRLTDFVGLEDFPALSPDGRTVAFTADTGPNQQIWIRLTAGGSPLQITRDGAEHLYPRWSPDGASIVYYTPPTQGQIQGTLWEVSAMGGAPRRLTGSLTGADVSHDGKKLAFFRANQGRVELVVSTRDTAEVRVVAEVAQFFEYSLPRWSPDDRWIAFQRASSLWEDEIAVVSASGSEPTPVTHEGVLLGGFCWRPDGSGVIYSSARGTTIFYLPIMHLWTTDLKGSEPRQLTYGETSLQNPDTDRSGKIVASRLRMQFDIWKYPVGGIPADNVRRGVQITRQTGQVQTPTVGPGDHELAYLSDEGGHGNLWVIDLDSGAARQITSESDPRIVMGVPVWSPDGSNIVFFSVGGKWNTGTLWLVGPDGSNLRRLVDKVSGYATWSGDSRWVYYTNQTADGYQILKIDPAGGSPLLTRTDRGWSSAVATGSSALYFVVPLLNVNGVADHEIRVARPENGPSRLLARISGIRVPHWQALQAALSHDGKWLALPLNDGAHTDLWLVSTANGELRQVTDFGQRRTFVARRVSWSCDDHSLYAAVGDGDADIVQMEGILR